MAKFKGTGGKDNFKGGSGKDVFVFDTTQLSAKDNLAGGSGVDALVLINSRSASWVNISASQWHGLSGIEGVVLASTNGAYGFKLAFDNTFFKSNHVKEFEIVGTGLTGVAQGLHVSAAKVNTMAFRIDGSMSGEDKLKTGKRDDTFVYVQDTLNIRDTIDGGGGENTLILSGAGASTPIKDGGVYVSPDGYTYLANVRNIDRIVVTDLKANQSRTIEFGTQAGTADYTGSGTVVITTDTNVSDKKAAAIAGKLIVEGTRLKDDQILYATGGNADDRLTGGDGKDHLAGGDGNDLVTGNKGNDTLAGDGGNDTLIGGLGGDAMNGGGGNDRFTISDTVFGSAAAQFFKDDIDGGDGADTLSFSDESGVSISAAALSENSVKGIETIELSGTESNAITLGQDFVAKNHDVDGYLNIISGSLMFDDQTSLSVDASAVTDPDLAVHIEIHGNGQDNLKGGAGDDIFEFAGSFDGASYGDSISGGGGKDVIRLNEATTSVFGPDLSGIEVIFIGADDQQFSSLTSVDIATSDALTIDGSTLGSERGLFARGYATDPDTDTTQYATGQLTFLGGKGADTFVGGLADDVLTGGDGDDVLYGRLGADTLTGGSGTDYFVFVDATDSTVAAAGSDTLADFSQADGDKIYFLHTVSGALAFDFIGDDAFGQNAGEVRSFIDGDNTIVQLDQTGDGKADFQLVLTGELALQEGDFLL